MDDTQFQESMADNLLFSALGGICAVIVGIAIFGAQNMSASPGREPASEVHLAAFTTDLPVLE
ncbi:MAG: hypothetical protein EBX52_11375 [Proteobacteria bacterium]|nr:hypothetical protein [Pseudomonadota bacterium]